MANDFGVKASELSTTSGSVLFGTVSALVIVVLLIRRKRYVAFFKDIPGPKAYPIIGNVLEFLGHPPTENYELFFKYFGKFGYIYRLWIGTDPYIIIGSPDAMQSVLSSSDKIIDKGSNYDLIHKWLKTGLITSKGEKWHHRRKLLTPSFHFKILESFIEPAKFQSDQLVRLLQKEEGKGEFDITEYAKMAALDLIAETTMGYTLNAQTNRCSDYAKAISTIASIIQTRVKNPLLRIGFIYNLTPYAKQEDDACEVLHALRNKIIKERRAARQQLKKVEETSKQGKLRLSLLDFMLELNMSNDDIGEEVDSFMFAGHDTVGTTVKWSLFLLGQHKDIQVNILKEFASLVGSTENPFSLTSINKLEYLERCVKETLRLYTPLPFIFRMVKKPIKIENHYLPKGTTVMVFLHAVHKNPQIYPNPEKFDPDRFLPANSRNRHPFSYIPFSAGPRNCIAQKYAMIVVKIILIKILKAYEVSTSMRATDLKLYTDITLLNKGGVKICLEKRNEQEN